MQLGGELTKELILRNHIMLNIPRESVSGPELVPSSPVAMEALEELRRDSRFDRNQNLEVAQMVGRTFFFFCY